MAVGAMAQHEVVERVPNGLYIGGEWRAAGGDRTLGLEDPATGERLAEIDDATAEDAVAALDAAAAVQGEWAAHLAARARRDPAPIVSNAAAPFGGVKASGFGREGGREGIEEYLSMKDFAIAAR